MNGYDRRQGWVLAVAIVLLTTLAGVIAYNVGLSHGVADAAADPDLARHYGWHGHWGLGPLPILLFIFLWIGLFRGLRWGWGGPGGRHRGYAGWHDGPSSFDDWHRRAHERMKEKAPDNDSGR